MLLIQLSLRHFYNWELIVLKQITREMPNLVKPERQKKKKSISTSLQSLLPVLITTQKQPHAEIHLPKVAGNISNKKK